VDKVLLYIYIYIYIYIYRSYIERVLLLENVFCFTGVM